VALSIGYYRISNENRRLNRAIANLVSDEAILAPSDSNCLAVRALPRIFDHQSWTWRIQLPPGYFQLFYSYEGIPSGIPEKCTLLPFDLFNDSDESKQMLFSISVVENYATNPPSSAIKVSDEWKSMHFSTKPCPKMGPEYVSEVAGTGKTTSANSDQLVLIRSIDLNSRSPGPGFIVWIQRVHRE